MVWEPFLLAIGFGLAVSAGIYFAVLWPQVEPLDEDELAALGPGGAMAAVGVGAGLAGGGSGESPADTDEPDADEPDADDAPAANS